MPPFYSLDKAGSKAQTEQELTAKYVAGPKAETEQELTAKVRILCWVMTSPQNLDKKAQYVKKTWGKRFDVLLFMSSVTNDTFPTIGLNVSEGRSHLTAKTMLAFRHVYEHYLDKADWFMKADDDTYVIVENLRYFLKDKNTNDPVFFGHHFVTNVKQGYFSGGAGYVISKEALRRFGKVKTGTSFCKKDGGSEDVEFARCMEYLGVKTGSSIDAKGNSRFHCFDTLTHLRGGYPQWYYSYDEFGAKKVEELQIRRSYMYLDN